MYLKDLIIILLILIIIYLKSPEFKSIKKIYYDWKYPITIFKIKYKGSILKKYQNIINDHINNNLNTIQQNKLKKMCKYGLVDGKKIRPCILLSIFEKLSQTSYIPNYVLDAAIAIEYIHCSSLILDDMMDNDIKRRGKKCIHIKYGKATAQLIAIQLVVMAIENICNCMKIIILENNNLNKNFIPIFCNIISKNITDLNIGQFMDINFPINIELTGDTFKNAIKYKKINMKVEDMIHKKTSSLFEISFIWAWILSSNYGNDNILQKVEEIGIIAKYFGLIFQICDDFEDVNQDLKKDGKNCVMNYVICFGPKKSKKKYYQNVEKFINSCIEKNIYTELLQEIIMNLNFKTNKYYKHQVKKFDI